MPRGHKGNKRLISEFARMLRARPSRQMSSAIPELVGHWGICSTKDGSARDSTVAARCRLGSSDAVLAAKRAR